jgi:two-component sensor histidine kinase
LALGTLLYDPVTAKGNLRINCAMEHEGRLLAGCNNGLFVIKGSAFWKVDPDNVILNDRINAMTLGNNGQIWLGLANQGIVLLQGEKVTMVDPQFKIVNVRKLRMGPDGSLWACNQEGAFKFTRRPDGSFLRETFTSVFGYPIANTWDILPMPTFTYAATDQGLIRFEAATNDTPPRLIVEEVDYGGQTLQCNAQAPVLLDHSGKRLTVRFSGINFRNYGQLSYHYRIPQIDDQWQTTTTTEIEFLDMRHGDYVFELKAESNSGLISPVYTLKFSIAPQFWQTIWFLVCCFVVVAALVFLAVRRRVRVLELKHQREQEKSKKEIERIEAELYVRDLEQKAMRLQMNPHFIFNALNTIQGLYANKDIPKAKEYISKLSTLIRQILEQSGHTTITLGKELELVTGYLNVTLYRFENLFTFKVNVQEGIQLESVAVPPLILQPIVENSVIHGIAPKGANGKIDIDVTREGESIVIRVRDNGVGLQQSKAMRVSISGKTTSKGMNLTQERLRHIWENAPGSLVIEEIKDENDVVAGTMVTIRLAERMKE